MNEKKIAQVRKLLALAERAGTPGEADAARERALALMQQYAIDEAMLVSRHEATDQLGSRRFTLKGWAKPKTCLLSWVADAVGCKTIILNGQSTYGTAVCVVYGWDSDLAMLEVLYTSLEIQAMREMEMARSSRTDGSNGQAFTRSFLTGFASMVAGRLKEQRDRQVADRDATPGTGTALVLADRSVAVEDHFRRANPRVRTGRASTLSAAGGFYAGQAAGERADLGQGGLAGQRRAVTR